MSSKVSNGKNAMLLLLSTAIQELGDIPERPACRWSRTHALKLNGVVYFRMWMLTTLSNRITADNMFQSNSCSISPRIMFFKDLRHTSHTVYLFSQYNRLLKNNETLPMCLTAWLRVKEARASPSQTVMWHSKTITMVTCTFYSMKVSEKSL
jgi:hypothetical protein